MSQFHVVNPASMPSVPTTFTADTGSATPAANNLNIFGSAGIATSGAGSTITLTLTEVVPSYVSVTGPTSYVVTATDYFISCDSTLGAITIQLPNSPTTYDQFVVKDRTGTALTNNITVTTVGGVVLIDGSATYVFDEPWESIEVLWNGTSYEIF